MVQVFRPTGLRCTACWCVSLQGHPCTFLHYVLCWKLVSSTQTPTPPHYQLLTPEQLGTDAIHNFFDTLGGAHRCDFTYCPDFKDCETSPIQATKGYFFFLAYLIYFLVSWPHSSWTGPLEVFSPTLVPARPTTKPDQASGILSRVLSICKDRDLISSPGILVQGLNTFIGGGRGGGGGGGGEEINFPCSYL